MRRLLVHGSAAVVMVVVVVAGTAGVSGAKGHHMPTPHLKSALASASVSVGSGDIDTATLKGTAKDGSPTGTITFFACGPTSGPTPCTSPNFGPDAVSVTAGPKRTATATENITPTTPGWYCFLDEYNGDSHYQPVSDNNTGTECLDATGSTTGPTPPTLTSALSSATVTVGSTDTDTATVTGNSTHGSPTGTLTFAACGPTTSATPCTSPNIGPQTAQLSSESGNRSFAQAVIGPGAAGWYCFLDTYNGDANYSSVSDSNTATECLHATGSSSNPSTPTLTSSLSSVTITLGSNDTDTATVTGNSTHGSPTGTMTFGVCGPTASAAPCTSPNIGPESGQVSLESGNRSFAQAVIGPGAPGWYCFLDIYNGDANYTSVSDNNTATECLHVASSSAATAGPDRQPFSAGHASTLATGKDRQSATLSVVTAPAATGSDTS